MAEHRPGLGASPDPVTQRRLRAGNENAFVVELLMPRKVLEQEPELQRMMVDYEESIEDLAKRYGVSRQAMTFRLVNLGFIKS